MQPGEIPLSTCQGPCCLVFGDLWGHSLLEVLASATWTTQTGWLGMEAVQMCSMNVCPIGAAL